MLVLSRKRGEEIVIGNGTTVTVLAVEGGRVKIGITAPAEVPVRRKELHWEIEDVPHADCACRFGSNGTSPDQRLFDLKGDSTAVAAVVAGAASLGRMCQPPSKAR
jgi:carbon storage regulator